MSVREILKEKHLMAPSRGSLLSRFRCGGEKCGSERRSPFKRFPAYLDQQVNLSTSALVSPTIAFSIVAVTEIQLRRVPSLYI